MHKNDHSTKIPLTAPATVFVSHAWRYNFYSVVVDVMEQFAAEHPDAYFWFDLFTNDQNDVSEKDFEWFCKKFRGSIKKIGHLLLVLSPWDKPIPIGRSWCLYEIHSALRDPEHIAFSVTLPGSEVKKLKTAVTKDSKCIVKALTCIRAEEAEAREDSENISIIQAIESVVGLFGNVNLLVKNGLRKWYVNQLQLALQQEPENHGLLMNAANVMRDFGFLDEAMTQYTRSLALHIADENKVAVATCYNNIALVHHTLGEYEKALEFYEKSLLRRQNHFGEGHVEVAESYNNIGNVHCAKRSLDEALTYYDKALDIAEALEGDQSDIVATCYNNVATVYTHKGELKKAKEYDEKAIAIISKRFGQYHPKTATSYNSEGNRCYSQRDPRQALKYFEKALAILLQVYGDKHHDVAVSYSNIANAHFALKEFDEALSNYEKSIDISVKALGDDSIHIADIYNNMAELYARKGDLDNALSFHEQSLVISSYRLGAEDPKVAKSFYNIGNILANKGELDKALEHHNDALRIRRSAFEDQHDSVTDSYERIAIIIEAKGDKAYRDHNYDEGLECYEKSLSIYQNHLQSMNTLSYVNIYSKIAEIYQQKGELEKALESLHKSLAIKLENPTKDYVDVAISYHDIAKVLCSMKQFDEALQYCNKALEVRRESLGDNHLLLADSFTLLADVHARICDYDKSIECLQQSLTIKINHFNGYEHLEVAETLALIGRVVMSKGDSNGAWEKIDKALKIRQGKLSEDDPKITELVQLKNQLINTVDAQ